MIFFLLRRVNVDQFEYDIFFFQSIHEENVHDFLHDCSYVHNNVSIRCLMAKAYSEHNIRIISAWV